MAATKSQPNISTDGGIFSSLQRIRFLDTELILAFLVTGIFWLIVGLAYGTLSTMFDDFAIFNWQFPSNAIIFGGFSLVVFGLCYYMIPKLTEERMFLESKNGWTVFVLWNIVVLLGLIYTITKKSITPLGVFPSWVGLLMVATFILVTLAIAGSILLRKKIRTYISVAYLGLAFAITALALFTAFMLIIAPDFLSAKQKSFTEIISLHSAVVLWFMLAAFAVAFYFLPLAAERPLYSRRLAYFGLGSWILLYPFFLAASIIYFNLPMNIKSAAQLSGLLMLIPAFAVMQNFLGTMQGNWKKFGVSYTVRFTILAALFYFLLTLADAHEAVRVLKHNTLEAKGVFYSNLGGVCILFVTAGTYYIIPRISGRKFYSPALAGWHWWLTVIGFFLWTVLYFFVIELHHSFEVLNINVSRDALSYINAYTDMYTITLGILSLGYLLFLINIILTVRKGEKTDASTDEIHEKKFVTKPLSELLSPESLS